MSYYEKVLAPGETVRAIGHLHWMVFSHAILLVVLAIVVFAVGHALLLDPAAVQAINYVGLALLVLALLAWIRALIRRAGTEIVVTDKRVIYKRGFLSRYTIEMNITKIETVDVEQSIGGRIFGYGTLLIRGTGSGLEPLRRIGRPLELRNAIVLP
jgi:uncharacterized membrane protein YdbT with pleckstrin-like domain